MEGLFLLVLYLNQNFYAIHPTSTFSDTDLLI